MNCSNLETKPDKCYIHVNSKAVNLGFAKKLGVTCIPLVTCVTQVVTPAVMLKAQLILHLCKKNLAKNFLFTVLCFVSGLR